MSQERVFLGGINIFLQEHSGFFRKTPAFLDRLLDSNALLRLTTRYSASVDPAHLRRLTLSMLRGVKGFQRKEIIRLARFIAREVAPEVVNLPNSLLIGLAPAIKAEMNVPVSCTLQGEELFLDGLGEPWRGEALDLIREHAPSVDRFIAVSDFGARHMAKYLGLEPDRIRVAPLGIHFDGYGERSEPVPFTVGYLARITPEKGLHILSEAYKHLRANPGLPPSRLWAAGYMAQDKREYLAEIQRNLEASGLSGHFRYHGELDRQAKLEFLGNLSILSVPGPYDDPKGLFLLEAMAAGVPVVQPRRGAFTEIVEKTGGGILVEPDDPGALAAGILRLWKDAALRGQLGERARRGVRDHYGADAMARKVLEIFREIGSSPAQE